jgi:hypothetical protein
MWKSVEIGEGFVAIKEGCQTRPEELRACSGCAGDYEDPDRTASSEDDEEEADGAAEAPDKKFPVQE